MLFAVLQMVGAAFIVGLLGCAALVAIVAVGFPVFHGALGFLGSLFAQVSMALILVLLSGSLFDRLPLSAHQLAFWVFAPVVVSLAVGGLAPILIPVAAVAFHVRKERGYEVRFGSAISAFALPIFLGAIFNPAMFCGTPVLDILSYVLGGVILVDIVRLFTLRGLCGAVEVQRWMVGAAASLFLHAVWMYMCVTASCGSSPPGW